MRYLNADRLSQVACTEVAAFEYVVERTQYALLEDGTVWNWYYHVGFSTTVLVLGAGLIIDGITGVLVAWVIGLSL